MASVYRQMETATARVDAEALRLLISIKRSLYALKQSKPASVTSVRP